MSSSDQPAADPAAAAAGPAGAGVFLRQPFTGGSVRDLRHQVADHLARAGATGEAAEDFVQAVNELVTNAVRHAGGGGVLELRRVADTVVCDVIDHGAGRNPLTVRAQRPTEPGGRGLWLAHQLTGSLLLTRRPDGVTASVTLCLEPRRERSPADDPASPG
jgi:anti-sigma regulatory factor (Ser/Thr protein kinase)